MKKNRVYVDTSVIGGCLDDEFKEWSNGLLSDFKKRIFVPVVSELTVREIAHAPLSVRTVFAAFRKYTENIIVPTLEMQTLADAYQTSGIVTRKFADDALHIAIATVAKVDILVSWNFKHIVHFDKIRRFNAVNKEMGYAEIMIYSPREVTGYGHQGG